MPVIHIELGLGQTNEQQKSQLIQRLATDAADITGVPVDKFVTFVHEYPLENIGLGAKSLRDLRSGR